MSGGVDYFTHCSSSGAHDLWFGEEEKAEEGYLTDLISKRAVDYVQRMAPGAQAGTPFFLSLHYTAPHWPWETRDDAALAQEIKDNLFHLHGGNIHTYRRMIQHMDEGIGWLVDELKTQGLLDNTLIVFTSDNGGERFSDNWPLVGGKMDLNRRRHPRALDRALAGRHRRRRRQRAAVHDDGLVGHHAPTRRASALLLEYPLDGVLLDARAARCQAHFRAPAALAHEPPRPARAARRRLEIPAGGRQRLPVQPGRRRTRALQPRPARAGPPGSPARRLAGLGSHHAAPSPADATVSLGYSAKDMPQR